MAIAEHHDPCPIDLLAANFGAVLLLVKLVVISTIIGLAVAALIERRWRR